MKFLKILGRHIEFVILNSVIFPSNSYLAAQKTFKYQVLYKILLARQK